MQDFYGWKSASMTMEYISTSRAAVQSMASSLYPLENGNDGMSAGIMEPQAAGMSGMSAGIRIYIFICIIIYFSGREDRIYNYL